MPKTELGSRVSNMAPVKRAVRRFLFLITAFILAFLFRSLYLHSRTPRATHEQSLWKTEYIGFFQNSSPKPGVGDKVSLNDLKDSMQRKHIVVDGNLKHNWTGTSTVNVINSAEAHPHLPESITAIQLPANGNTVPDNAVIKIAAMNGTAAVFSNNTKDVFTKTQLNRRNKTVDQIVAAILKGKSGKIFHEPDTAWRHKEPGLPPVYAPGFYPEPFSFTEDTQKYMEVFHGKHRCLIEGTDTAQMQVSTVISCKCKKDWHGTACSIPELVSASDYPKEYAAMPLEIPRRIVYGMPFSHEFDLLEAKINELHSVVDVFVLLESNFTAAGLPNERKLLHRLQDGYLKEFRKKLLYVRMNQFPRRAYVDGWIIDRLLRSHIGDVVKANLNLTKDDVIIITDVDEIPRRETLLFIKLHDGFPEPFGFVLRHNMFGFFWRGTGNDQTSNVFGGATMGYLENVANGDLFGLRGLSLEPKGGVIADNFWRCCRGVIRPWLFGSWQLPAGWHCSWCLSPSDIREKLLAAHVSDTPRWGTIPGKTDLNYIQKLIDTGTWFDGKTSFFECTFYEDIFAPKYIQMHPEKYNYILNRDGNHSVV